MIVVSPVTTSHRQLPSARLRLVHQVPGTMLAASGHGDRQIAFVP
jgi:hypothetical protein